MRKNIPGLTLLATQRPGISQTLSALTRQEPILTTSLLAHSPVQGHTVENSTLGGILSTSRVSTSRKKGLAYRVAEGSTIEDRHPSNLVNSDGKYNHNFVKSSIENSRTEVYSQAQKYKTPTELASSIVDMDRFKDSPSRKLSSKINPKIGVSNAYNKTFKGFDIDSSNPTKTMTSIGPLDRQISPGKTGREKSSQDYFIYSSVNNPQAMKTLSAIKAIERDDSFPKRKYQMLSPSRIFPELPLTSENSPSAQMRQLSNPRKVGVVSEGTKTSFVQVQTQEKKTTPFHLLTESKVKDTGNPVIDAILNKKQPHRKKSTQEDRKYIESQPTPSPKIPELRISEDEIVTKGGYNREATMNVFNTVGNLFQRKGGSIGDCTQITMVGLHPSPIRTKRGLETGDSSALAVKLELAEKQIAQLKTSKLL